MTTTLAILDDEPRLAEALAMMLRRDGHECLFYTHPDAFLEALEETHFDLLLTDLKMPGMDGVEVLRRVKASHPAMPVLLVTAYGTVKTAIQAMREGAFDYIEKPFDNQVCKTLVRRALALTRLERENRHLRETLREQFSVDNIIAVSSQMQDIIALVRRAARSRATVLISGESGTGKEVVARLIHYYSERVGQGHLAVNCKAFAAGVLESELFGHEKGAFTGASQSKAGLFERADGGTLFLDEIGEVDAGFQAKLLRVLQEREITRVGGDVVHPVDVRVVAATNKDLPQEVEAGHFREDLYFRLAVIPIHLPPLRERKDDILPLARHFFLHWCEELQRPLQGWDDDVERYLLEHPWPGNIRELENAFERAVVLARGDVITLGDIVLGGQQHFSRHSSQGSADDLPLHEYLDRMAACHIRQALKAAQGVRIDAARALGIERTTLYRLIKKYQISEEQV